MFLAEDRNIKDVSFKKGMPAVDIKVTISGIKFLFVNVLHKSGGMDFCQN